MACSFHVVVLFVCGWYEAYRKVKTPEIYRSIFHRAMELSEHLELKDYESTDFYDRYARALDKCVDDSMNIAIKTGVFIENVILTILSLVIIVTVDPVLIIFMIIPMFISLYFGTKNSKCNYDREKAITRDKRTADYVKRVYYEKKYAAEIRLYDINSLMLEKQENAIEKNGRGFSSLQNEISFLRLFDEGQLLGFGWDCCIFLCCSQGEIWKCIRCIKLHSYDHSNGVFNQSVEDCR